MTFFDRDGRGRGVLIAVKNTIHASRRTDLERVGIELVVVELRNGHDKPLLLYCFYHPDDSPEPLLELNMSLCENNESTCLVAIGNFNLPELDWSGDQSAPTNTGSRTDHNIFCELMADNFFQQFIPGPTHIVGNKLDLLLTNWPEIIDYVSTFHPREGLFPSDHYAVDFMIKLKFKRAMARAMASIGYLPRRFAASVNTSHRH